MNAAYVWEILIRMFFSTNNRFLRSCSPCKEIAKATSSLRIINPSSRLQLKMHLCLRLC